jgi:hypothetical protein
MKRFYVYSLPDVKNEGKMTYQVVEKGGCYGCKLKYEALKMSNRILMDDVLAHDSKDAATQFVEWRKRHPK